MENSVIIQLKTAGLDGQLAHFDQPPEALEPWQRFLYPRRTQQLRRMAQLTAPQQMLFSPVSGFSHGEAAALTAALKAGMQPSAYIRERLPWLLSLLPENVHSEFLAAADLCVQFLTAHGYMYKAPFEQQTALLQRMFLHFAEDVFHPYDAVDWMNNTLPEDALLYARSVHCTFDWALPYRIAARLNENDARMVEATRRILTDRSKTPILERIMVGNLDVTLRGVLYSCHREMQRLLAARLTDSGWPRWIYEYACWGTPEGLDALAEALMSPELLSKSTTRTQAKRWLLMLTGKKVRLTTPEETHLALQDVRAALTARIDTP